MWEDDESYDSDEGEAGIGLDKKPEKKDEVIDPPYNDYFDKENSREPDQAA